VGRGAGIRAGAVPGALAGGPAQRNTSAWTVDRSSEPPKDKSAVLPPIFTIFRRKSLIESSRADPMCPQPWVSPASVVSRTRAIAIFSRSCACAPGASGGLIVHSTPASPVAIARVLMALPPDRAICCFRHDT
jgi:hypothetical protein